MRFLLEHDPEVNFRAYMAGTPLHWAYFGTSREVIQLLLDAEADPTQRDTEFQCTPRAFGICVAANWGIARIVRQLLAQDPTLVNISEGRGTPLHEAARAGQVEIVQILLRAGADISIRDAQGSTPLDLARTPRLRGQPPPPAASPFSACDPLALHLLEYAFSMAVWQQGN